MANTLMKFLLKNGEDFLYGHHEDLIGCDEASFDLLIDFDQIKK